MTDPPSRSEWFRHPLPPLPTQRGQRTRERLIRAAESVFGDVGFYDTRISEITREAGVASGTFYLYFSSKEQLFRAVLASLNHDLRRTLREGTGKLPNRAAMESEGLRLFFRYLRRHRKLYRIVREAASVDPTLYHEHVRRMAAGYRIGLARAMDTGELKRADPELLAYALLGIADFVATRYVIWGDGLTETKIDQLVEMILHGLVANGEGDGQSSPAPSPAPSRRRTQPRNRR